MERGGGQIYAVYDYKMCLQFILECIKRIPDFVRTTFLTVKRWSYARPVWKRTIELNRFYESIAEMPVKDEKYIYFALHYQPEASSNPLGWKRVHGSNVCNSFTGKKHTITDESVCKSASGAVGAVEKQGILSGYKTYSQCKNNKNGM